MTFILSLSSILTFIFSFLQECLAFAWLFTALIIAWVWLLLWLLLDYLCLFCMWYIWSRFLWQFQVPLLFPSIQLRRYCELCLFPGIDVSFIAMLSNMSLFRCFFQFQIHWYIWLIYVDSLTLFRCDAFCFFLDIIDIYFCA